MRVVWISVAVLGLAGIALGLLWFLQGSDLLHIDPILCAAECRPVVGHHPGWQAAGAVTATIGALAGTVAAVKLASLSRSS